MVIVERLQTRRRRPVPKMNRAIRTKRRPKQVTVTLKCKNKLNNMKHPSLYKFILVIANYIANVQLHEIHIERECKFDDVSI